MTARKPSLGTGGWGWEQTYSAEGDSQDRFLYLDMVLVDGFLGGAGIEVRKGNSRTKMRRVAAARWRVCQGRAHSWNGIGLRQSVRSSRGRRSFGNPGMQLGGDSDGGEVVATSQLGMSEDEG
jgi:hypothetical protein